MMEQHGVPAGPGDFRLGHRRWLDGLRGVAILLVLAYHFGLLVGGFLGVDLFFVLSGFLITALLVEEWQRHGGIDLRRFYLRRALRLLPAFTALLLGVLAYHLLFRPAGELNGYLREMLVAACYLSNWQASLGVGMGNLGHTWSLSVEEQFYLIWPLLLSALLRSGLSRRWVVAAVAVGVLASAVHRFALFDAYQIHRCTQEVAHARIHRLYMGLDTRADALLTGCLVALLVCWSLGPPRHLAAWLTAAALAAAAGLAYHLLTAELWHSRMLCSGYTLVAVLVGVILLRLLAAPARFVTPVLESAPLVWAGRLSYGLYLYHIPVKNALGADRLGWDHPGTTLLAVGLSVALAVASYWLLERPCLRLKDRLRPAAPPPPVILAGAVAAHPRPQALAA